MEGKKALFRIQINGITESTDAVKALNSEIKELKGHLKELQNAKIKVSIDAQQSARTVVSAGQQQSDMSALAKLQNQLAAAQQKAAAQTTQEYQKQYQVLQQIQQSNKENEHLQKQIASGVRDASGQYADSLAGLRAYLSDLQKAFNQQKLGTEEWEKTQKELSRVRELVKGIEQSTGDFRRNVGNYPSGAKELITIFNDTKDSIAKAKDELSKMNLVLSQSTRGSEGYNQAKDRIDALKKTISDAEQEAARLNAELGKKIQIQVGDGVRYFDNLRQAAKELNAELQNLTLNGQNNTKEFNDTIKALGNVRTAMASVSSEVSSYIGNAKGLKDTVEIMRGLGSIASLGQGLVTLFGGQNEELDKTLKTFTGITMVMNGLSNLQQQINDRNSVWGQTLGGVWNWLNKGIGALGETLTKWAANTKAAQEYGKTVKGVVPAYVELSKEIEKGMTTADASILLVQNGLLRMGQQGMKTAEDWAAAFAGAAEAILEVITQLEEQIKQKKLTPGVDQSEILRLEANLKALNQQYFMASENAQKLASGEMTASDATQALDTHLRELNIHLGNVTGASEKSVKAYAELDAKLSALKKQLGGVTGAWTKFNKKLGEGNLAMQAMGKLLQGIATGVKAVATSFKALLSSTIILGIVMAALDGIKWVLDQITGWVKGDADLASEFDGIAASISNAKDRLDEFNREIDRQKNRGELTELEANKKKFDNLTEAVETSKRSMIDYINTLGDVKKLTNELIQETDWDDAWGGDGNIKNMAEFEERYKLLVKAVLQGVDEVEAATGSGDWYKTAGDAAASLAIMQKAVLSNLEHDILEIFLGLRQGVDTAEKQYKEFIWTINKETNASALANIDKLFEDDKWQAGLKQRIEQYRDFARQMLDLQDSIAAGETALTQKIAENEAAAIRDPYKRAAEQRRLSMEKELKEAGNNEELKAAIRKKYATQDYEARKQQHQKNLALQNAALQAEINAMLEGWDKQKALLELQRKQAIENARNQGLGKNSILKITQYWNRLILNAEREFGQKLADAARQRQKTMLDLETEFASNMAQIQGRIIENQQQMARNISKWNLEDIEFGLSVDADDTNFDRLLNGYKDYYFKLKEARLKANEEQYQIDRDAAEREYRETEDELSRLLMERQQYYADWLEAENKASEQRYNEGLITSEEYRQQLKENQQKASDLQARELQALNERAESEQQRHNNDMLALQREYTDNARQVHSQGLEELTSLYTSTFDTIEQRMQTASRRNTSSLGIINYAKERQNLKQAKEGYSDLMNSIEQEYEHVKRLFDSGDISFGDFQTAKGELDSLREKVKDSSKQVGDDLSTLFNRTVQSVLQMAQQYVSAFNTIYSFISNMADIELEQQQSKLDKEQELLDKETEMIEEAYDKQVEITRKYQDRIASIEDEIRTARGDRRDYLLDSLAKERDAMYKSLEAENKIEKEKEKNQKKQEKLEQRQAALDKKRWEQNKKNQVVQATINTFTAVTNALAVQPWFVGLALSSVALALGMANVAKIQSQKYYAKGGLLNGPSHMNGGIPVGNTGIEVEGGEYVVNKKSTRYNQPLIEYINSKQRPITAQDLADFYDDGKTRLIDASLKNRFADGGQLPVLDEAEVSRLLDATQQTEQTIQVQVVDIINAIDRVNSVKVLAGLGD